eukprot:13969475-Heterocapsa_arctica.AAC.1
MEIVFLRGEKNAGVNHLWWDSRALNKSSDDILDHLTRIGANEDRRLMSRMQGHRQDGLH